MTELTNARITELREKAVAQRENLEVADTAGKGTKGVSGLRVRASYGGSVGFYLLYRMRGDQKLRRAFLGKLPGMTLGDARRKATDLKGEIARGIDPVERDREVRAEKSRKIAEADRIAIELASRLTVRQMAERFLIDKADLRWEPRYRQMLTYNLIDPKLSELQLGIGDKAAEDLTATDIDAILSAVAGRGARVQARRVYEVLRAMVRWAHKKKLIPANPIDGVSAPTNAKPRERVLSVDELRTLWLALASWDRTWQTGGEAPIPHAAVRVLLLQFLTGARSGEVAGMRKHEISPDGYEWTIPGERSKNGDAHVVPLAPAAREVIAAAVAASAHPSLVFPVHARDKPAFVALRSDVISKHVADFQTAFGFKDRDGEPAPFVAHDLRRCLATFLRKLGIDRDIVAALLNHKSEKSATVTGRHYDHERHEFAKREALTRWQAVLVQIAEGADPFTRNVSDIEEMERQIIARAQGPKLVTIAGGRA